MRTFLARAVIVASALLIAASVSAQTQGLERVGPTSTVNGYPTWYQDKTGVTLEFCSPLNTVELEGGWCLLLPPLTVPEVFPTAFFDEHFYFAAGANLPPLVAGGIAPRLDLAIEGAFRNGPVIDGDQITFARIRFVFTAPVIGTYTIRHPYGTDTVTTTAVNEKVFVTEDIGIDCVPGAFDCALRGRIGPFLLPSSSPGGAELAAIPGPVPGKLYIADPARLGPVTGSPVGQDFFEVEGPFAGSPFRTTDFSLMGRVYQGTMPGRMTVDRARYARASGSPDGKTDVFATAFATAQPRLPASPVTGLVTPILGFYPAACSVGAGGALGAPAGVSAVQMFGTDTRYYGQIEGAIPAAVCVQDYTARDVNGQAIPSFVQKAVTDQVAVLQAEYNPASGGLLTVAAWSSDQNALPTLAASLVGTMANQADGTAVVTAAVGVPPVKVFVTSAAGGHAELEVSTLVGQPALPDVPIAGNDAFTINEDSPTVNLDVFANDTMGGVVITSGTITITQAPALGTAAVNTSQSGWIDYTPAANRNGSDLLAYTVTVAGQTSAPAFVSITINPVNDAPVAVNDTGGGVGGLGFSINLLANDTDVDCGPAPGCADLVGVNIVSAPAGLTYTLVGGTLSFTAAAGTYNFTYQARDAAGALSANTANVTVTLTAGDTLTITRAEYIQSKRRWRVTGTASNPSGQTVYVSYANGTFATGPSAAGTLVGSTTVDALGNWVLDFTLAGTNDPRNPTSTLFSVRPTQIYATSTLGGRSPNFPIAIK